MRLTSLDSCKKNSPCKNNATCIPTDKVVCNKKKLRDIKKSF